MLRLVGRNPISDRGDFDAFFRSDAGHRDVDGVDQPRRRAIVDGDNRQTAVNSGIDAKDLHHDYRSINLVDSEPVRSAHPSRASL